MDEDVNSFLLECGFERLRLDTSNTYLDLLPKELLDIIYPIEITNLDELIEFHYRNIYLYYDRFKDISIATVRHISNDLDGNEECILDCINIKVILLNGSNNEDKFNYRLFNHRMFDVECNSLNGKSRRYKLTKLMEIPCKTMCSTIVHRLIMDKLSY